MFAICVHVNVYVCIMSVVGGWPMRVVQACAARVVLLAWSALCLSLVSCVCVCVCVCVSIKKIRTNNTIDQNRKSIIGLSMRLGQ